MDAREQPQRSVPDELAAGRLPAVNLEGVNVLVVDDEPDARALSSAC